MQSDHYHFVTNWKIEATLDQVAGILRDPTDWPRWWPSVYIDVAKTKEGSAAGVGAEYDILSRGWLPYKLRWHMKITETREPHGYRSEVRGDMIGIGVCSLVQNGEFVEACFDWEVVVRKAIVRLLSSLIRPLVSTNHRWAMARGQMSLERELKFQAATTDRERDALGPPPGPMAAMGAWATFALVMVSIILPGSVLMRILKHRADKATQ